MRVIVKYVCFYIHKSKERERVTGEGRLAGLGGGGFGGESGENNHYVL